MKKIVSISVFAVVALIAATVIPSFWADYLWYASLGKGSVFTITLISRVGSLVCCTAFAYIFFGLWMRGEFARVEYAATRTQRRLLYVLALVLALLASLSISSKWMTLRLAVSGASFGIADPFTKLDAGFFVFTMPALELIASWLTGLIFVGGMLVLGIALFLPKKQDTAATVIQQGKSVAPLLYRWFTLLMLSVAFNWVVSAFREIYSQTAPLPGVSDVDAFVNFPAALVLGAGAVVVALIAAIARRNNRWKLLLISFLAWSLVGFVSTGLIPRVFNTFVVGPNELSRELPYLQSSLDLTRKAFGLSSVQTKQYPALQSIKADREEIAQQQLGQARIWTPQAVKQAFKQLETVRPYYKLSPIQPDRYLLNGRLHETLVSAREINPVGLPKSARNWINTHLVYTHGYGLAIASASQTNADGLPTFLVGDIPPVLSDEASASATLVTKEPRIYFGDKTTGYAVVNTKMPEFDHVAGKANATSNYAANTGIKLDTLAKRLVWATKLGSLEILASNYITSDSQLLLYRSMTARVGKLTPWLTYDASPYPALVKGRIVWILDGFTSTDHFPYSKALKKSGQNYLRNSVKVVMDAYSGEMTFYAFGDDPIRDAWARIYPGVITPSTDTPKEIAAHFRYPKMLFDAQAEIFKSYHMKDATTFYSKEDQYDEYLGPDGKIVRGAYTILHATNPEAYSLVKPYSLSNVDNLASLLVASCEPDSYGKLTNYALPRDRVILGPTQITARIQQDPDIAQQLALWSQNGNTVIYGEMLIAPIQDSIVYVQPIFLTAKNAAITELVGVVSVHDNHIRMGKTLREALEKN